jgi:hypothetical protein
MDVTTETAPQRPTRRSFGPRALIRVSLVAAAVVVLGAGALASTGGALEVLEVTAAVVLGCVAVFAATSLVAAVLLARAVRRGLRRMPPVDQIGRPFEASHDDVHVASVEQTDDDELVIDVVYGTRRVVLLDAQGAPQSVETTGPSTTRRTIVGASALSVEDVEALRQLSDPVLDVSLVEQGLVTLAGPVTGRWELRASNGTVVRALP